MPATYADIDALPPHITGQIVAGELLTSRRNHWPAMRADSVLAGLLGAAFDLGLTGPGGWHIYNRPGLYLGDDVLVPSIAAWRRPMRPPGQRLEHPPDWICEVLSPATALAMRNKTLPAYARLGVQHAWLVDPGRYCVEVYENRAGAWVLLTVEAGNGELRAAPFDAVGISLKAIWLNPPDEPGETGGADQ